MTEPDYLARTREAWGKLSEQFFNAGRRSWATDVITWGIWDIKESDIHALGDLGQYRGMKTIELGCGTGYVSAWLAKLGAEPVGIDPTPEQLANCRLFQQEFGIEFPVHQCGAESLPFEDESFDFAISEYGAAIWSDPYLWIPEAARVLKPGARLVFLRNSTLSALCTPDKGMAGPTLLRDYFGMNRIEWSPEEAEEFHLTPGAMIDLLGECGMAVERLIELQAPLDGFNRFDYIDAAWAHRWPSEEIWVVRKR